MVKLLLHLEGLVVLLGGIYFYQTLEFSWLWFVLLLLVPDISMLGYLMNNHFGSIIYNIFHTYILPAIVIIFGVIFSSEIVMALGLIWLAHIGMDRMIGFGLKYPIKFKDTHLNHV